MQLLDYSDSHKLPFESKTHGVSIQQYHAENGRFADNYFIKDAAAIQQKISYRWLNDHHQHGKPEKRHLTGRNKQRSCCCTPSKIGWWI